jgi:hypothetical protein
MRVDRGAKINRRSRDAPIDQATSIYGEFTVADAASLVPTEKAMKNRRAAATWITARAALPRAIIAA